MADFDHQDFEQLLPKPKKQGPSLKARAVAMLSRREHSRLELARKLAPHTDPSDPQQLDRVLDELERDNWLSDVRFAQSLAHRRASQKGSALVLQELRQHGLSNDQLSSIGQSLQSTELQRATEVWKKKFGSPPADAREYARQFRFLASRGFASSCLKQILGSLDSTDAL